MFGGEGEPFMHKDLPLFVQKSKEYGMDVSITTNGVLFDKEKMEACLPYLSWIKFSVDAGNEKQYANIHRTPEKNFDVLIQNIKHAVEFKRKNNLEATIGTQFLMIPESIAGAKELDSKLREFEPDYLVIKPYSFHPKSQHNQKILDSKEYQAIEESLNGLETDKFKIIFRRATLNRIIKGNDYPQCYGLPFISLIDSLGNVLPCNLFYDNKDLIYGNLYEQKFSEIWESEKRKSVLEKIRESGSKECRNGCRCDVINRYLHRLRHPQAHDNFT
jgi:radical SAM protein with 4Fe4S-binding SPASM domain